MFKQRQKQKQTFHPYAPDELEFIIICDRQVADEADTSYPYRVQIQSLLKCGKGVRRLNFSRFNPHISILNEKKPTISMSAVNLFILGPQLVQNVFQAGLQLICEMRIQPQLTNSAAGRSRVTREAGLSLSVHIILILCIYVSVLLRIMNS